jgi:hypothetical protein
MQEEFVLFALRPSFVVLLGVLGVLAVQDPPSIIVIAARM